MFLGYLALHAVVPLPDLAAQLLPVALLPAVFWFVSRPVLDFRAPHWLGAVLIGVLVFAVWIAPDLLFPAYRKHWLFENVITGSARTSLSLGARSHAGLLILRALRAALIVPVAEELFWRAWLMRWLISPDFRSVRLGAYTAKSFWMTALLFACEHGSYWEVGLAAGVIYNWWMVRTRSLGDLILAHAVTNACLSAYVIAAGKWEYWL